MAPLKGELSGPISREAMTEGFVRHGQTLPPQFANWGTSPFRGGIASFNPSVIQPARQHVRLIIGLAEVDARDLDGLTGSLGGEEHA